jgi:hypothetical protein
MKKSFALVLFMLVLGLGLGRGFQDSSGKTVADYMKARTAPEWKNWISGIGVGFWVANKELISSKRDPLFCFSGNYEPDAQAVLDAWIAKERASRGLIKPGEYFGDRIDVEVALLIAYEDSFSCTAKGR